MLIASPKDIEGLSSAMFTLIKNENLRIKIGFNGRLLVEQGYAWNKVILDLDSLLSKLSKTRRRMAHS